MSRYLPIHFQGDVARLAEDVGPDDHRAVDHDDLGQIARGSHRV